MHRSSVLNLYAPQTSRLPFRLACQSRASEPFIHYIAKCQLQSNLIFFFFSSFFFVFLAVSQKMLLIYLHHFWGVCFRSDIRPNALDRLLEHVYLLQPRVFCAPSPPYQSKNVHFSRLSRFFQALFSSHFSLRLCSTFFHHFLPFFSTAALRAEHHPLGSQETCALPWTPCLPLVCQVSPWTDSPAENPDLSHTPRFCTAFVSSTYPNLPEPLPE